MKIIYGGSFNPPTKAHYNIAEFLLRKFPEYELVFLPVSDNYSKEGLVEFSHRFNMLEIYSKKLGNRVSVSDYEAKLEKYQGTIKTLEHFNNPYFVIGADNLLSIKEWVQFPDVLKKGHFLVIPRNNINVKKIINDDKSLWENRDNFIIFDDFLEIPISASEYRSTKNGELLDNEIKEYIKKFGLY